MRMGEIASEGEERASQLLEKIKNDVDTCCAETPKAATLAGSCSCARRGVSYKESFSSVVVSRGHWRRFGDVC